MTRWVRVGNSQKHKKLPEDATPWKDFWQKQNSTDETNQNKVKSGRIEKSKHKQNKKIDIAGKQKAFEKPKNKRKSKSIKEEQDRSEDIHNSPKFSSKNEINEEQLNVTNTEFIKVSKKASKKAKLQHFKNNESNDIVDKSISDNSHRTELSQNVDKSIESDFQGKKKLFLQKLEKKRKEKGILLLPAKVERRLYNIKRRLREKGLPPAAIKDIARKERRKEELKFQKISLSGKPCFNCRQVGHFLADCPMKLGNSNQETGICFKCGSAEHTSYKCPEKIKGYPLAKCFICKEQGHISKDCPQNEHGVYIKGGKCQLCGNVNHLKKDCPTLRKKVKDEEVDITAYTINEDKSIDAEIVPTFDSRKDVRTSAKKGKKAKLVKF